MATSVWLSTEEQTKMQTLLAGLTVHANRPNLNPSGLRIDVSRAIDDLYNCFEL